MKPQRGFKLRYLHRSHSGLAKFFCCLVLMATLCPAQEETWARTMRLAQDQQRQGQYAEAEAAFLNALKQAESLGPEDPRVAITLNSLGGLCDVRGKDGEAEQYYQRAISLIEKPIGQRLPGHAWPFISLAALYLRGSQYSKAEQLSRRAATLLNEQQGQDQPQIQAKLLQIQGTIQYHRGDYSKAQALYLQALGILQQNHGNKDPTAAGVLTDLGSLCEENGLTAEAIFHFEEAVAIWQELSPEHPALVIPLTRLMDLYQRTGHPSKADSAFERALRIAEGAFGPEHRRVAEILVNRAAGLREAKRSTQAKQLEKRAKVILAQQRDAFRENTIDVYALLKEVNPRKTKP